MESLLTGLSEAQREAVAADDSMLCVLAGAGSGKTRVLTRRVAWLADSERIDPAHALILTFTRKAASELTRRLAGLGLDHGVATGTFHSVAYAQLRARWADRGVRAPRLIDRRRPLFGEVLPELDRATVGRALGELDWARARLIGPGEYPNADRSPPIDAERLAEAFVAYAELKKRRRLVDFDDLLGFACRDLHADQTYAEAIQWRFRHFFVDEFQDVNPLQSALLDAWRSEREDLCVVGDPDQAIYGWNGADATHLIDFAQRPDVRTIALHENFRSAPAVVAMANQVLDANRPLPHVHRGADADPILVGHADDRAEAAAVARAARDAHRPGSTWSAQAVLVRTNAQTALIQDACAAAGVPYRVRGGRTFVDHPTVASAVESLRRASGGLRQFLPDLRALDLGEKPANDATEHLDVVVRLAVDQLRIDRDTTAAAFADLLATAAESEVIGPSADAVDILTFHAAKGLEWPVVHLAGLEDGYVPTWRARSPAELAEERRLLYVAMTRARDQLTMHWARERSFGERTVERLRSPFLRVFDEHRLDLPEQPAPGVRSSMRDRRQDLDHNEPFNVAHDALHATLLAWRSQAARAAGVDPGAVLSDEVLLQIAHRRPSTHDELAEVAALSAVRRQRYGDTVLRLVAETGLE